MKQYQVGWFHRIFRLSRFPDACRGPEKLGRHRNFFSIRLTDACQGPEKWGVIEFYGHACLPMLFWGLKRASVIDGRQAENFR
jgi:hypothetical protein